MKTNELILHILETSRFGDWYDEGGRFMNYLRVDFPEGHPRHVSKSEILKDVDRIFSAVIPPDETP